MEAKEKIEFLSGKDKPFFVDQVRKLIGLYDNEEITLSKLVEVLNFEALDWHNKTGVPSTDKPSINSMEELFKNKDKIISMTESDIDAVVNRIIPKNNQ